MTSIRSSELEEDKKKNHTTDINIDISKTDNTAADSDVVIVANPQKLQSAVGSKRKLASAENKNKRQKIADSLIKCANALQTALRLIAEDAQIDTE